jgi:A/G-specific adenine glycosylase
VELNETVVVEKKSAKKRQPVISDSEDSGDDYSPAKEAKPATAQLLANNYKERTCVVDNHLEKKFKINLNKCNVIRRTELGSIVHLFSHIRKTYHMEHLVIHSETLEDFSLSEDMQWVSRDELAVAAIPTGLKKGIKLMDSQGTTKSLGTKVRDELNSQI